MDSSSPPRMPFRFQDPRQERIHARLRRLVGPGPASFYLDACRIMAAPTYVESTTHLVSHLCRDIESAIRDVLGKAADENQDHQLEKLRDDARARAHSIARLCDEAGSDVRRILQSLSSENHYDPAAKYLSRLYNKIEDRLSKSIDLLRNNKNHKKSILEIIEFLEISKNQPVVVDWLRFADWGDVFSLPRKAHRDALDPPRAVDVEFVQAWQSFQNILDEVLARFEVRYAQILEVIDQYRVKTRLTKDDIHFLQNQMPNNTVTRRHLFSNLDDPSWLGPLKKAGFFRYPPVPIADGDNRWPESRYLARIASQKPGEVASIFQNMPASENPYLYCDIADAMVAMPASLAVTLVPKLKEGFSCFGQNLLADPYVEVVSHLSRGGETSEALAFAYDVLAPRISPELNDDPDHVEVRTGSSLETRFDRWWYEDILRDCVPILVCTAGTPALEMLCDLLDYAMQLSEKIGGAAYIRSYSQLWRDKIGTASEYEFDPKNHLVSAICNAGQQLITASGKAVLDIIEARPDSIFRRIGIYLRQRYPDIDKPGTETVVQDQAVIRDPDLWYELCDLLAAQYGTLSPSAQYGYLELVDRGPDTGQWLLCQNTGDLDDAKIKEMIQHWQYVRLAPIRNFLPPKWQQRYEVYHLEFGQHTIDLNDGDDADWPGLKSPLTADQITGMSVDELIAFVNTWQPSDDWNAPSPLGLAQKLQYYIAENPTMYAAQATRFLEIDPLYSNRLIEALKTAIVENKTFAWPSVISLCLSIVQRPADLSTQQHQTNACEQTRRQTLIAMADLLFLGLQKGVMEIPYALRSEVWPILSLLVEDPDPTLASEKYSKIMLDPHSIVPLGVRDQGIRTIIQYAEWVHCNAMDGGTTEQNADQIPRDFSEMPEVRTILETHLTITSDPSVAVHSVYGQWFPLLLSLDETWTKNLISRIFPADERLHIWRRAAWKAFISCNRPDEKVLTILEEEYSTAVERISPVSNVEAPLDDRADQRLADHLMYFYIYGFLEHGIRNRLLTRFYETAPEPIRAHAIQYIGHRISRVPDQLPTDVLIRLYDLWDSRMTAALAEPTSAPLAELSAFGWWYASGKLDARWAIRQLEQVLSITHHIDSSEEVLGQLEAQSFVYSLNCVRCIGLMVQKAIPWNIHHWGERLRNILRSAIDHDDPDAQKEARELANRLVSMGYTEYRELSLPPDRPLATTTSPEE